MGRGTQRLQIAVLNLVVVALFFAAGYLGFQNIELRRDISNLRDTIDKLNSERQALVEQAETTAALIADGDIAAVDDVNRQRQRLEQQVADQRGLAFTNTVDYLTMTRDALGQVINNPTAPAEDADSNNETSDDPDLAETLRRTSRGLAAFGLVPADSGLTRYLARTCLTQDGAFYRGADGTICLAKDIDLTEDGQRSTVVHQLAHALVDQHHDRSRLLLPLNDNLDHFLASTAVIEGDATTVETLVREHDRDRRRVGAGLRAWPSGSQARHVEQAPFFLRHLFLFPKAEGSKFFLWLYTREGTAAMDRVWADPPVSTEQVLHPDRYLWERDDPTPVDLADRTIDGWSVIWENTLGEFAIQTMLAERLSHFQSRSGAEGWDGDRCRVYERAADGATGVVWQSIWDAQPDAYEFTEVMGEYLRKTGFKEPMIGRRKLKVMVVFSTDPAFVNAWRGPLPP